MLEQFAALRRPLPPPSLEPEEPSKDKHQRMTDYLLERARDPSRTPYGYVDVEPFEQIRRQAESAIARCKDHKPPNCACWNFARTWLWQVRVKLPERSPESHTARRIWIELEEVESRSGARR
jgi:hypothetical protein